MEKPRERDSRFTKPDRGSSDQRSVDNQNFFVLYGASSRPFRIVPNLVGPLRPRDDVVGIAFEHVLDGDCRRRLTHVGVDILRAGNLDELVHVTAARDRNQRRIPDMPEDSWLAERRRRLPHSIERAFYRIRDSDSSSAVSDSVKRTLDRVRK